MKNTKKKTLMLALSALLLLPFHSFAAEPADTTHSITVEGVASKTVQPTAASLSLGIIGEGPTAQAAKEKHDEQMNRVIDALLQLPLKKSQISTANLSIEPLYQQGTPESIRQIGGYRVQNILTVQTEQVDVLMKALNAAVNAGVNSVSDLRFTATLSPQEQDALLSEAVKNGTHQAELVARAGGAHLGKLISATVQSGNHFYPKMTQVMRAGAYGGGTPILPEEQKVTVSVNLVYELI